MLHTLLCSAYVGSVAHIPQVRPPPFPLYLVTMVVSGGLTNISAFWVFLQNPKLKGLIGAPFLLTPETLQYWGLFGGYWGLLRALGHGRSPVEQNPALSMTLEASITTYSMFPCRNTSIVSPRITMNHLYYGPRRQWECPKVRGQKRRPRRVGRLL